MRRLPASRIAPVCAAVWMALAIPVFAEESTTCSTTSTTDHLECLAPRPVAENDGTRYAWGSTREEISDAWVARFREGEKEPLWRVQIGGAGNDAISSVTLSRDGKEVLVAGSTTSPEIDGFTGRNAGGRDGLVARLDVETGRLLSGTFVGGPEDEELSGVVADLKGNIVVTGIGKVPEIGEELADLTVIESAEASTSSPVFLTILDGALERSFLQSNLGDLQVASPRVWTNCKGDLVFGVSAWKVTTTCNGNPSDIVYQQNRINEDYSIDHTYPGFNFPPGGWGYHALRWKYYYANATYNLDWNRRYLLPGVSLPERWLPGCSDAQDLNQMETVLFTNSNGVAVDPSGGWGCGNHSNVAELGVFTAHLFRRWGTPVYTGFKNYENPWTIDRPVGLERVSFRPFCPTDPSAYSGQTLEDLCNLFVDDVSQLSCPTNVTTPGVSGPNYLLLLQEFEGTLWTDYNWWRFRSWSPPAGTSWYKPGVYVMDPPENSEAELAILQEASRQTAGAIVRQGTVRVTERTNGVVTCQQKLEAVIAATE